MNDPTKDKSPDLDFILKSVQWYPDEMFLDVQCSNKNYVLEYADRMFIEIMPQGEYQCVDPDTGMMFALLDSFNNMHWLVRDFSGHILYRAVNLKPILENIAERKYHNWQ
jgi:hypothetical protein